jgi:small subunit ribosomal protein S20
VANHASAEKRNRQNIKRAARNRAVRSHVRSVVKKVRLAIASGNKAEAATLLTAAISKIDQAVSKGVYKHETGSRYVSRLSSQVSALS